MTRIDGLHISDGGSGGVPVVFLHGLGSDLTAWRGQLDHLRATRRAIAFDLRGHGESEPAKDGVYTVDKLTGDLEAVVSQLGLTRFWLVGHSMSGAVLSTYAGRHPEKLAGLIYIDAVGDMTTTPSEIREYFRKHDAGLTPPQLQETYGEMLAPRAKPGTRKEVLATAARMDLRAFGNCARRCRKCPGRSS